MDEHLPIPSVQMQFLDDIDELSYKTSLGLSRRFRSSRGDSLMFLTQKKVVERYLQENLLLPKQQEASPVKNRLKEIDEEGSLKAEEKVSEISVTDKIRCMKYSCLENFAEMFVDEIIDISVEVCEQLQAATEDEEGHEIVTELPCICDSPQKSAGFSMEDSDSLLEEKKKGFTGWPSIKHFTLEGAKRKIMEFMSQWYFVEDWKYTVHYINSYSDLVSDYHLFQGIWSIPTKEYPVAQATATIFFTIEVSRVKPDFCLVNVMVQLEGSNSTYKAGQFEFIEQWLFNIIDSKLNLFRTLRF